LGSNTPKKAALHQPMAEVLWILVLDASSASAHKLDSTNRICNWFLPFFKTKYISPVAFNVVINNKSRVLYQDYLVLNQQKSNKDIALSELSLKAGSCCEPGNL
jgi:hypothetical protein